MEVDASEKKGSCHARVLIVDDDEQIRHLLTVVLERAGIRTEIAKDGAQAIEKIHATRYDLVLLDLMMPRVDGFEVLRCLDSLPKKRPAIVVVSASPASERVDRTCVQEVIDKPFDIAGLLATVRRSLGCDDNGYLLPTGA